MCNCGRYESTHLYPAHTQVQVSLSPVLRFILVIFITSFHPDRNVRAAVGTEELKRPDLKKVCSSDILLLHSAPLISESPSLNKVEAASQLCLN